MTIKIAQVGFGYWGPNLLRNLFASSDYEVVWLADLSEARLKQAQQLYPTLSVTTNLDEIFLNTDVQAVVVATPAATHYELCKRALISGKHVLVEKPMATKVSEVVELGTLADRSKLVLMSGHTFIFSGAVRYLKKLVVGGELGDIRYLYSQRLNLGRIRSDIDALWNFCPHDISIAQYLLSDLSPVSVHAYGADHVQDGIADVVFANAVYPNKILANFHVSWLDPRRSRLFTVVGSKKMVVYDDTAEHKIAIYDKGIDVMAELGVRMDYDAPKPLNFSYRDGDVHLPKVSAVEPLKEEVAHFAGCIRGATQCETGVAHTVNVIRILEEASRNMVLSGQTGSVKGVGNI